MDSLDVIKVCLRRWYVFIPLLLIAAGAGFGLKGQLRPTYMAVGGYAFVYPHPEAILPNQVDPRAANPLISNGNAALLGESVQSDLNSATQQTALGGTNRGFAPDQPPTASHYSVTLPPQSASYVVQTWADTEQGATDVLKSVLAAAPESADGIQERAGASLQSRYTTFITAPAQTVELPAQSPIKLFLTVLAVGAVAGAAFSLLVDKLFPKGTQRRASTRTRRTVSGSSGTSTSEQIPEVPRRRRPTISVSSGKNVGTGFRDGRSSGGAAAQPGGTDAGGERRRESLTS